MGLVAESTVLAMVGCKQQKLSHFDACGQRQRPARAASSMPVARPARRSSPRCRDAARRWYFTQTWGRSSKLMRAFAGGDRQQSRSETQHHLPARSTRQSVTLSPKSSERFVPARDTVAHFPSEQSAIKHASGEVSLRAAVMPDDEKYRAVVHGRHQPAQRGQ